MKGRIITSLVVIFFAVVILAASIFRSASPVSYAFSLPSDNQLEKVGDASSSAEIYYYFAYPGKILPDNPLWFLKVVRDKIWLGITTDLSKKAELNLLFADKRLVSSRMLFEKNKPELALSTLTKAEKYLEKAANNEEASRKEGGDTSNLLLRLANASLKHTEVVNEILEIAPSDAKPEIIKTKNYSEIVFERSMQALQAKGMEAPKNPFNGDI